MFFFKYSERIEREYNPFDLSILEMNLLDKSEKNLNVYRKQGKE